MATNRTYTNCRWNTFKVGWNQGNPGNATETVHTHWYCCEKPVLPGVYRFEVEYLGEKKSILVQSCENYEQDTRFYVDFGEPVSEPVADSCISVNTKVAGARVLIEVEDV